MPRVRWDMMRILMANCISSQYIQIQTSVYIIDLLIAPGEVR